MTIRISLFLLASLLVVSVLATLPGTANAHVTGPVEEEAFSASRIMATGPLNLVVFEVSGR